jgi:hypothetical protein
MVTQEAFRERWQRKQRLRARLRLAAFRLEAAEVERVWAGLSAHRQGLSIRKIAAAVGLSRARVHQLLGDPGAMEVPARLNALRERGWPVATPAAEEAAAAPAADAADGHPEVDLVAARLAEEVAALRECLEWLERLERGEPVAVNLLPESDGGRYYVGFDRPRVLRVARRVAEDLDELSRVPSAGPAPPRLPGTDPAEHRRRLAEPPPAPPRLSGREERAALRAAAGLDPLP